MRSGNLRTLVSVESYLPVFRDDGDGVCDWTAIGSRYAEVLTAGGGESDTGVRQLDSDTRTLKLRGDTMTRSITTSDRLLVRTADQSHMEPWQILGVRVSPDGRSVEIDVERETPKG